jgi:hypothetical protein
MIWLKKLLIWHYTTTPYPTRMANMGDEFDDEVSFLWYDLVCRRLLDIKNFIEGVSE